MMMHRDESTLPTGTLCWGECWSTLAMLLFGKGAGVAHLSPIMVFGHVMEWHAPFFYWTTMYLLYCMLSSTY